MVAWSHMRRSAYTAFQKGEQNSQADFCISRFPEMQDPYSSRRKKYKLKKMRRKKDTFNDGQETILEDTKIIK